MILRDVDDREERTRALRGLLGSPIVGADEQAYALIRRHERELASTLQVTYGYQLEVGSTAARASGLPTAEGLRRPLRIRPASISGQKRPPDEWPALSDRACVILLLTLVALERGGAQTAIAEARRGTSSGPAPTSTLQSLSTSGSGANVSRSPTGSTCYAPGESSSTRPARARATRGESKVMTRRCSRSIAGASRCCSATPRRRSRRRRWTSSSTRAGAIRRPPRPRIAPAPSGSRDG